MRAGVLMSLVILGAAIAGCNKEDAKPTPPTGGNTTAGGTDATGGHATTRPSDAGSPTTRPSGLGSSTTQPSGVRPTTGPTTKP